MNISFNKRDRHLIERLKQFLKSVGRKAFEFERENNTIQVFFCWSEIARWLKSWRVGNSRKIPPSWVEYIDPKFQKQLVLGYIDSDGWVDYKKNEIRITSVCLEGLLSLRRILARLGIPSSIRQGIGARRCEIEGRFINCQTKYDIRFRQNVKDVLGIQIEDQSRYSFTKVHIENGYIWSKVKSKKRVTNRIFVPIKTETGEYITHFGVSHNCDDLESTEMVRSKTQRDAVQEWFNKDVMFVGGEAHNLDIFIIGTVIGHEALLNKLMDPNIYPDFKSIRFKAVEKFSDSPLWDEWARIYTDSTDKDRIEHARQFYLAHEKEMLRGTKVLWPEGDPYYDNMVAKLTDPSAFLQEKQNESIDLTKVKIRKEEMAFIDLKANTHLLTGLPRYGALDPSLGKKTSSGDYSVITTLAWNKETSTAYVIDINMKRRSVDKQIQDVIKLFEKHEWRLFGVETTAFQYVLAELLRKETKKLGMFLPIKEIDSKKDKLMRFESLFPFMRDGTIVFDGYKYERQAMYRDAVDQILYYTGNKNDRDDVLDSLEMCFSLVKGKRFKLLTRPARGSRIIR